MTERQQAVGATSVAVLGYAYDFTDRITEIGYPSGRQVRYYRDAQGRVLEANRTLGGWQTIKDSIAPVASLQLLHKDRTHSHYL